MYGSHKSLYHVCSSSDWYLSVNPSYLFSAANFSVHLPTMTERNSSWDVPFEVDRIVHNPPLADSDSRRTSPTLQGERWPQSSFIQPAIRFAGNSIQSLIASCLLLQTLLLVTLNPIIFLTTAARPLALAFPIHRSSTWRPHGDERRTLSTRR